MTNNITICINKDCHMAVALGCLSDPKSDNFIGSDWTRMAY